MVRVGPRTRSILAFAGTAGAALLLSLLAIELTRLRGGISLLWLANAPLLATLCLVPQRRWAGHVISWFVGAVAAAMLASPIGKAAPIGAAINLCEIGLALVLLRRADIAKDPFENGPALAQFVLVVATTTALSGIAGAGISHALLGIPLGQTWLDWVMAHSMGYLIAMPLAVQTVRRDLDWRQFRQPRQAGVAAAVLGITVATTAVVFAQNWLPILFLPVLPLMIATFAYQRIGAAAGIVVVALVGGAMTLEGTGPIMLVAASEAVRLQFFNFYLAVLFLVTLPVAAILAQRDQLSRRLGEREAFYRLLADHATDIMLTMDADGTIRFASPSVRELGFFEPDALVGRNAAELVHPDDVGRIRRAHMAAIADPHHTHNMEYRAIKANGAVSWFETNTRAVRGDDGQIETVVSVIRDLSDRKRREDELVRAATTDPLTGLLNRVAFHHAMTEAISAAKRGVPATLAMLDLDHFKQVNDSHGHATGDAALLMLADLLRDNLRGEDAVGRIGGEEFAILFPGAPIGAAAAVCKRLCTRLARAKLDASGTQISITMSMGLTSLAPDMSIEDAFRIADEALYAAKHAGRNRIQLAEPEPLG